MTAVAQPDLGSRPRIRGRFPVTIVVDGYDPAAANGYDIAYEAGILDGWISTREGIVVVEFQREGRYLSDVLARCVADVERTGGQVVHVETFPSADAAALLARFETCRSLGPVKRRRAGMRVDPYWIASRVADGSLVPDPIPGDPENEQEFYLATRDRPGAFRKGFAVTTDDETGIFVIAPEREVPEGADT
jgi:hypothetical protein